jgi:hypothetical protein
MKTYQCGKCKNLFPGTTEYFFNVLLSKAYKNSNINIIGQCKTCAKEYGAKYRQSVKSRKFNSIKEIQKNPGKIYIIGVKGDKNAPYKIGMTSGNKIRKRIEALQTSHWQELEVIFETNMIPNVRIHESELHNLYKSKRVRGEWYMINKEDIKSIKSKYRSLSIENNDIISIVRKRL